MFVLTSVVYCCAQNKTNQREVHIQEFENMSSTVNGSAIREKSIMSNITGINSFCELSSMYVLYNLYTPQGLG
jgi:hypothetical protein